MKSVRLIVSVVAALAVVTLGVGDAAAQPHDHKHGGGTSPKAHKPGHRNVTSHGGQMALSGNYSAEVVFDNNRVSAWFSDANGPLPAPADGTVAQVTGREVSASVPMTANGDHLQAAISLPSDGIVTIEIKVTLAGESRVFRVTRGGMGHKHN